MKASKNIKPTKKRSVTASKVQPVACPPSLINSVSLFSTSFDYAGYISYKLSLRLECFFVLCRLMSQAGFNGSGLTCSALVGSLGLVGGCSFKSMRYRLDHLTRSGLVDVVGVAVNNGRVYAPSLLAYELVSKYMNEFNVSRSAAAV